MRLFATLALAAIAATPVWCVVHKAERFETSAGTVEIIPIHHASVVIRADERSIYVDPFCEGNFSGLQPADLILITDIHGDHMDPGCVSKVKKAGTEIMAPAAVAEKMANADVIKNGETKRWSQWSIEAVPMYNLKRGPAEGRFFHDKGRGNGYVLTYGGKRFYFSGDTEAIPEMRNLKNIDAAFVCMNVPYTMTPEEAADGVKAMHPKVVYPYHYRNGDKSLSDLKKFEQGLAGSGIEVRIRDWYAN
jgi:L-ascorbate metabolism protein UlaG (beta-lactamase superfamily)